MVLVFYFCMTIPYKLINLKTTHNYYLTVFCGLGVWAQVSWFLCPGSHQAELKVSVRAAITSEAWSPFSNSLIVGRIHHLVV